MRLEIRCALLLAVSLLPVSVLAGPGSVPTTAVEAGLVDVAGLAPDITVDMRYLGSNNFTGAPVPGYQANRCYLRAPAAQALARVQQAVAQQGYRLQVFDCYRPVRAVQAFVRMGPCPGRSGGQGRLLSADRQAGPAQWLYLGYVRAQPGPYRGPDPARLPQRCLPAAGHGHPV